jgi:hypothetical protein
MCSCTCAIETIFTGEGYFIFISSLMERLHVI